MRPRLRRRRAPAAPRACVVLHGWYPLDARVEREVRVALDEGYEVDVFATRQPGQAAEEVVDGARVVRMAPAHLQGGGLRRALQEYLGFTALVTAVVARQAVRRRYRVVHVNNPPDFLLLAALVPRLLGARVILDIHDLSPEMFAQRFDGRPGAGAAERILRAVERVATRFADEVVTVHEPYRRELVARGVPPGKITVVMNTVDERADPPRPPPDGADGFRVVYHGTVTPLYGVELLVEAAGRVAADVPRLRLEVYGHGDALPAVRARADQLGIADRVSLSGRFVPRLELLGIVRSADVGVIPNLPVRMNLHALPTKLFEYVTLGVPVVCADLPTIREHFSDEEVLYYRAGDADALADALRRVASDPEGAARRAAAALVRYEAYRWPVSARRYAGLLPAT
jgi:glycosyltransferase involved in cell wall biosynthesis